MKKVILFSLITICTVVLIYSCSKTSIEEIKSVEAKKSLKEINKSVAEVKVRNSLAKRETSEFDHYFSEEELAYLNENFGAFDLNTLQTTTLNDKKITTVCSQRNDENNFKRLVITEKNSKDGAIQAIKDIFTITSTTETINEALNEDKPKEYLNMNIVCLNIGTKFDIDNEGNINDTQLGFNVIQAARFLNCFKSCWAHQVMEIVHNPAKLLFCGIATEECAAAITAECAWSCTFGDGSDFN